LLKMIQAIPLGIRILRGNMYLQKHDFGSEQGVMSAT
jgi:hypothetical protein